MAARWRWQSWHVAHETSSRWVAGHMTTARPAGVVVFCVVVLGSTTTTGPALCSASMSASAKSFALKLTVKPHALAWRIHAIDAASRWCE